MKVGKEYHLSYSLELFANLSSSSGSLIDSSNNAGEINGEPIESPNVRCTWSCLYSTEWREKIVKIISEAFVEQIKMTNPSAVLQRLDNRFQVVLETNNQSVARWLDHARREIRAGVGCQTVYNHHDTDAEQSDQKWNGVLHDWHLKVARKFEQEELEIPIVALP
jgi:hypothetical protein